LTAYSAKNPALQGVGWRVVAEVAGPFEKIVNASFNGVKQVFSNYILLMHVEEENEALKDRLSALESQNSMLLESAKELERVKVVVEGKSDLNLDGILADVIGYDPSNWRQTVTLNRGQAGGVFVGAAAVFGTAVVGQIINVSPNTSQVLLVTDHTSGVDSLVQRDRTRGISKGSGRAGLLLDFVGQQEDIKIGDRVITSGMDGVFPKGLLLGKVIYIEPRTGMFQYIRVKPAVSFRSLESVFVLTSRSVPEEAVVKPVSPPRENTGAGKRASRQTIQGMSF